MTNDLLLSSICEATTKIRLFEEEEQLVSLYIKTCANIYINSN